MNKLYLALAVTAIALPAYSQAPEPKQEAQVGADPATQEFVENAAIGDMYEIESSRLALDRAQAGEFQAFAKRIIDDHGNTSDELESLVQDIQGLEMPTQLDAEHREMIDELQAATGAQFDQLYRNQQVEAHKEAVQLFENYSQEGDNAQLQQFAERRCRHCGSIWTWHRTFRSATRRRSRRLRSRSRINARNRISLHSSRISSPSRHSQTRSKT